MSPIYRLDKGRRKRRSQGRSPAAHARISRQSPAAAVSVDLCEKGDPYAAHLAWEWDQAMTRVTSVTLAIVRARHPRIADHIRGEDCRQPSVGLDSLGHVPIRIG
jgi:hypothetical protein